MNDDIKLTDPLILTAIEGVRLNLKTHDELLPTWFIGANGKLTLVGTPFMGPDIGRAKDRIADAIRRITRDLEADFILFISEAWGLRDTEATKEYMADNGRRWKSVSEHPKAFECVTLMLETRTGVYQAMPEILAGRDLGEVKWLKADSNSGRFSNFLEKKERH